MTARARSKGPRLTEEGRRTVERVRRAGVALFKARGYNGTSVRALAMSAGLEAASLYHHFPSKQEILFEVFERVMDDFLAGFEQALSAPGTHEDRLRSALRFHVLFHIERQDEAFVSHSELRSLTAANHRRITAKRDRYEAMLRAFLADGVAVGAFEIPDVPLLTMAILTMCSGVSDWFTRRGRLSGPAVADGYVDVAMRLMHAPGHRGSGRAVAGRGPRTEARR